MFRRDVDRLLCRPVSAWPGQERGAWRAWGLRPRLQTSGWGPLGVGEAGLTQGEAERQGRVGELQALPKVCPLSPAADSLLQSHPSPGSRGLQGRPQPEGQGGKSGPSSAASSRAMPS